MSYRAEVCPLSRELILPLGAQTLSAPLQSGLRFFCIPLPAVLSAFLADRFPQGEGYGLTVFRMNNISRLGSIYTPATLQLRNSIR